MTPEDLSTKALFISLQYKCYTVLSPAPRGTPGALGSIPCLLYVCKESSITNKPAVWLDLSPGCSFLSWGAPIGLPPGPAPSRPPAASTCVYPRSSGTAVPTHACRWLAGWRVRPFSLEPWFESWLRPRPEPTCPASSFSRMAPSLAWPSRWPSRRREVLGRSQDVGVCRLSSCCPACGLFSPEAAPPAWSRTRGSADRGSQLVPEEEPPPSSHAGRGVIGKACGLGVC